MHSSKQTHIALDSPLSLTLPGGSRPSKSPLPNTPELASAPGSAEAVAIAGAPGEASQPQLSGREGPLEC